MKYLLDVNVLVALFDPYHVHHQVSSQWFSVHCNQSLLTNEVIEFGVVRVLYTTSHLFSLRDIQESLKSYRKLPTYEYISDSKHVVEFGMSAGSSSKLTTDFYLYTLAQKNNAAFVTFDAAFARRLGSPADIIVLPSPTQD